MPTINHFPASTVFTAALKPAYDQLYAKYPPYADFSFGNLAIWLDQLGDLRISVHGGNIVIECSNLFDAGRHTASVLGTNNVDETIDAVFLHLKDTGQSAHLRMVPESTVESITDTSKYVITEERDNHNYVLSTERLATLSGSSYGKLRRQVRKFESVHAGRFVIKELDLTDASSLLMLVNHMHQWDTIYTYNDQEKQESRAITTALQHAGDLGLRNLSLLVDGTIHAFSLYQPVPQPGWVIGNHTKASHHHKNAFNYLLHRLAATLNEEGVSYINFEQDMGIPGLREHKLGLRPVTFLKSYSVEPSPGNE